MYKPESKNLEKIRQLVKYKPVVIFISKVFLTILLLGSIKLAHRLILESPIDNAASRLLKKINIYELIANSLTYPAQFILNILDFETQLGERTISIIGARGVIVHGPCLGMDVIAVFVALVIAFPGRLNKARKALFIIIGLLSIHLLNILRVTALALKNNYYSSLDIDHHSIFNIVIYSFVIFLFYQWVKINSVQEVSKL